MSDGAARRTGWEGVPGHELGQWFDESVGIQAGFLARGQERHRMLEIHLDDARREIRRRVLARAAQEVR